MLCLHYILWTLLLNTANISNEYINNINSIMLLKHQVDCVVNVLYSPQLSPHSLKS